MKRLLLALAVLSALALPVQAQTGSLTAEVVDESGGTIPGTTITLQGPGGTQAGVTGGDGTYSFTGLAAGSYSVTADLVGFRGSTLQTAVTEGGEAMVDFTLEIALRGEEVVVTASKIQTTIVDAPATISVITAEQLENAPVQNFGDIMRNVPGVNVIQTSARDIQLSSRQATTTVSTATLVLVDGRSVNLDFFNLVLWDLVPTNLSDIKQIEVVRGPASAVWGANALSGVVNIITKSPREAEGVNLTLTGGTFNRDGGSREAEGEGTAFGGSISIARAPSDRLSFKLSGGYYDSDPYSRPVGTVPITTHPLDPTIVTGGAPYPADNASGVPNTFRNSGTRQPRAELRIDHDFGSGARMTYSAGFAGTTGIVQTPIGPFDMQSGSYMGYGRIAYEKDALKIAGFVNLMDVEAPNLLLPDPNNPGEAVQLTFETSTFDVEIGHSTIVGGNHILSYGGNYRRNNFDITIAPDSEDRNELGAYIQDEFFVGKFRLVLGGRIDKFGNIEDPVFSPRVMAMFKPTPDHSFRVSFNKAFRAPSTVNNFLDQDIFAPVAPIDLGPICEALGFPAPEAMCPPFPLVVRNVGDPDLKEESLEAWELAYTGTFGGNTTVGFAWYRNTTNDSINFTGITPADFPPAGVPPFDTYGATNPPPGADPVAYAAALALGIPGFPLPRTVTTYLNLGPIRQKGIEASIDHAFNTRWSALVNYSWQGTPEVLDPDPDQIAFPLGEVGIPAKHRLNAALNWNSARFVGSVGVNYSAEAFWVDVLSAPFHGATDSYTMVNASFGIRWGDGGKIMTSIKGTNIFNETVQQHVYGDIIKRAVFGQIRLRF